MKLVFRISVDGSEIKIKKSAVPLNSSSFLYYNRRTFIQSTYRQSTDDLALVQTVIIPTSTISNRQKNHEEASVYL